MDNRKKYLVQLFIKKCSIQSINKKYLDFVFETRQGYYKIEEEKLEAIKEKYTIEYFLSGLEDVIDRNLTENEINEAIKFYSSPLGLKLLNPNFTEEISLAGAKIVEEIDKEFINSINNNE